MAVKPKIRLSPEAKAIVVTSRESLVHLYNYCANATKEQVKARLDCPGITIFEESIFRALISDMEVGEIKTLEKLMERVYGKNVQPIAASLNTKSLEDILQESTGEVLWKK